MRSDIKYKYIGEFKNKRNESGLFYFPEELKFTRLSKIIELLKTLLLFLPKAVSVIVEEYANYEYLLESTNYILDLNEWVAIDKVTNNIAFCISKQLYSSYW